MLHDALADRVSKDQPALGLYTSDPDMVELMAHMGFDWVMIDQMFTANDWQKTELLVRTAEAAGITPVVRVQSNPWLGYDHRVPVDVTRALGIGAQYVLVSNSGFEEIKQCATVSRDWHKKAMHIHPFDSLEEWESGIDRMAGSAHVIPQPESLPALEAMDDTMALPEIDYFFFAMTDASRELNKSDQPDWYTPALWDLVDESVQRAAKHGVTVGANTSYAYDMHELQARVERLAERGVRMILVQGAYFLFQVAVGKFLREVRSAID